MTTFKKVGSQIREEITDTDMSVFGRLPNGEVIVRECDYYEIYVPNDDFAGWVLVIDGIGHEFCRTASQEEIASLAVVPKMIPMEFIELVEPRCLV